MAALREKQRELEESDIVFGRRLGISRQAWSLIRRGKRGLSTTTIQQAARSFPDLLPLVLTLFLPTDATIATQNASNDAMLVGRRTA